MERVLTLDNTLPASTFTLQTQGLAQEIIKMIDMVVYLLKVYSLDSSGLESLLSSASLVAGPWLRLIVDSVCSGTSDAAEGSLMFVAEEGEGWASASYFCKQAKL